jgi:hypothetical protein
MLMSYLPCIQMTLRPSPAKCFNLITMPTASEEPRVKKVLVQHIETVHHPEAVEDVLHSLLVKFPFNSISSFLIQRLLLNWIGIQI